MVPLSAKSFEKLTCYLVLFKALFNINWTVIEQRTGTVELQWLEHLWDYENMFETGVLRANEC